MCDSSTLEVQIDYSTSAFVVQVLGPERRLCGLHLSANVILLSQSDCHCMSDIVKSWPCEEDCDFFFLLMDSNWKPNQVLQSFSVEYCSVLNH